MPRLVHEQQTVGQKVDSLKDAKPGDLIVLNGGDHIAIYMGNDTVIHAPYPGRTVSVQKAWFDDADITTIRRIVPATDDAATGSAAPLAAATTPAVGIAGLAAARPGALRSSGLSAGDRREGDLDARPPTAPTSGSTTPTRRLVRQHLPQQPARLLRPDRHLPDVRRRPPRRSAQQIVAARTALLGTSA